VPSTRPVERCPIVQSFATISDVPQDQERQVIIVLDDEVSLSEWRMDSRVSISDWLEREFPEEDDLSEMEGEISRTLQAELNRGMIEAARADGYEVVASTYATDLREVRARFPTGRTDDEVWNFGDWKGGRESWWDEAAGEIDVDEIVARVADDYRQGRREWAL
jgi:hypothetical protein